jgi:hypothetical protein
MAEPGSSTAQKGDLVQVHVVVLQPDERAESLPESTRRVPYEGWIKGYLLDSEARPGDSVRIETLIGREVTGVLTEVHPRYDHDFGEMQPEINRIGAEAWLRLRARGTGR